MARVSSREVRERLEAEARAKEVIGTRGQKRKKLSTPKSSWDRAMAKVDARLAAGGEWEGTTPTEWVALYAWMHRRTYGSPASELEMGAKERALAGLAAGRLLRGEFKGDCEAMALFVRWAWQDEKRREAWRRQNGAGGAMGWRLLFGGARLADYRREQARAQARHQPAR